MLESSGCTAAAAEATRAARSFADDGVSISQASVGGGSGTASGTCSRSSTGASDGSSATSRSTTFASSRMFPGHG
jgi:hypothetical protein